MDRKRPKRKKVIATPWGRRVFQCRLSLQETQQEFANRMNVTRLSVINWENGHTVRIQRVHRLMLDELVRQLRAMGVYINDEQTQELYGAQVGAEGVEAECSPS